MEQQPEQSTPQEEDSIFNESDYSMKGYDKHIRNARIMLFILAGLQLFSILGIGSVPEEAKGIIIALTVFIAAVFTGLAFWTKKKPYHALLAAIIFYVTIIIILGILSPATIFQGLIVKIIGIVLLILGIRNAKESEDLKKTFGR